MSTNELRKFNMNTCEISGLKQTYQVAVVGGGPVGLFLGCRLHQLGLSFIILEKRKQPVSHSRSLGIHPVSLERFKQAGCVQPFLEQGIKIKRGLALSGRGMIGSISFDSCRPPFNFILSLPQYKTEKILERHLLDLNPDALLRGAEVLQINKKKNSGISLEFIHKGKKHTLESDFLVGCDGKESIVRKQAGISFEGSSYADTYIMGDFSDNTNLGSDAAIFLTRGGLIESFPLSDHMRRWVAKTDHYYTDATKKDLEQLVADRTKYDLSGAENTMVSSFGVQKLIANPIAKSPVALAGDAAHVVSPIGGQGMNLGWLDAWDLSGVLKKCFEQRSDREKLLKRYAHRRKHITRKAIRRAEFNMRLGRKTDYPAFRNAFVWIMLHTPFRKLMARVFTMHKLDKWLF